MASNKKAKVASVVTAMGLLFSSTALFAQESANSDLDSCVRQKQVITTVKGSVVGALAGVAGGLFGGNKKKDAVTGAAIGAVVGGIAGFATAYYTAIDSCYKENPSWIPESNLQRTKDYNKVKRETHYKPKQGVLLRVESVKVAQPVKAGDFAEVDSAFIVMTPDGAEIPVTIERKLFVVDDKGEQTEVPFPGHATSEQHTFEPGEQQDTVRIPIPHDAKPGSLYSMRFSVAAGDKPPVDMTQQFAVTQ